MNAEPLTVSLPPDLVARARAVVAQGESASVSADEAEAMCADKAEALARLEGVLGGTPQVLDLNAVRANWGLPARPPA